MKTPLVSRVGLLLILPFVLGAAGDPRLPAFPGAEGFGSATPGGRGGAVIFVTTLQDSGPGSFRAACQAKGPRIILFRVSGIIDLASTIVITEPFLTVAGQSAPGDGICLRGHGVVVTNTHDVVIRHLRVRPGDIAKKETDALSVYKSQNVVIDHCSASWATDETISVTGAGTSEVTVQWCIISESLNRSVHGKGPHGYGSLLRADGRVSFHHNLYAHHSNRNPRPGTYGDMNRGILLDFRNNVIYDWGRRAGYTAADKASLNYIANYLKPGPSTNPDARSYAFHVGGSTTTLYADSNRIENQPEKDQDNWSMIALPKDLNMADVRLPGPLEVASVTTEPPDIAYRLVLEGAGATRPRGDPVDMRIMSEVRSGTGRIIDSQRDVGGWPEYRSGKLPLDTDNDGMPDDWERKSGLNPELADDKGDADGDGYTNLEEYLNGL